MERTYIVAKTFNNIDISENKLNEGDYENCTFSICNFSNAVLSNLTFIDCVFNGCNFSNTIMNKTALRVIAFNDCKFVGIHFEHCKELLFEVHFERCRLNLSSFYKMKIKHTQFKNSAFNEVDFAEADLTGSLFYNCDMTGAAFENSNLEKTDFRTSWNYNIDPENNRLKKTKFSIAGISGLLYKYDIEIE